MKKPELLAPAGDLERLKIALLYGADAVYLGGALFGLRANATNFTIEEIEEGVQFAHQFHKKVYVTVNIVLHNKEIAHLIEYLKKLDQIGVDAIIISDPSVLTLAREHTKLEIHLSTQQSTLNHQAVAFWKKQGVTRIVLGREVTKEEIQTIIENVDIEIECFTHGAMCASYSGRCVLSNFLTERDANRGGCSQICRWDFQLLDQTGEEIHGEKNFTFCSKDLSMLPVLKQMMELDITSFKIEGRMRSIYYIASVVDIYRRTIDEIWNNPDSYAYNMAYEKTLRRCANRDSVVQFFSGVFDHTCNYYNNREEISNQDFLGLVHTYENEIATIEQRNHFKIGDEVEFFGPGMEPFSMKIKEMEDEAGNPLEVARHAQQIVRFKTEKPLKPFAMMRIKIPVDKPANL